MGLQGLLSKAMAALRDRSDDTLFRCTLDELGAARHSAAVRAFVDALTRGGPGGMPRPMELHAHDPIRYCRYVLLYIRLACCPCL